MGFVLHAERAWTPVAIPGNGAAPILYGGEGRMLAPAGKEPSSVAFYTVAH